MEWPLRTLDIPKIGAMSREEFVETYVKTELPVIIENFLSPEVMQLADPHALARAHADSRLSVMVNIPKNFLKDFKKENNQQMNLKDFVNLLDSSERAEPCYANQQAINKFPSLEQKLSFEGIVPGLKPKFIWFSSKEANIGLHFDPADGYLAQLYGRKRFFLIPHKQSGKIYPFSDDVTRSVVDLRSFDLLRFPKLKAVISYVGEIGPGDLLFIPRYMWHYFWGTTTSVSTNVFHGREINFKRIGALLRMYGFRYCAGVFLQMIRYGILGKPYEIRGYGWPPFGYLLWQMILGRLKNPHQAIKTLSRKRHNTCENSDLC